MNKMTEKMDGHLNYKKGSEIVGTFSGDLSSQTPTNIQKNQANQRKDKSATSVSNNVCKSLKQYQQSQKSSKNVLESKCEGKALRDKKELLGGLNQNKIKHLIDQNKVSEQILNTTSIPSINVSGSLNPITQQMKQFDVKKNQSHFGNNQKDKESSSSTSDYDSEREVYSDIDAFEEDMAPSQMKSAANKEEFERLKKMTCSMPALPDIDELDNIDDKKTTPGIMAHSDFLNSKHQTQFKKFPEKGSSNIGETRGVLSAGKSNIQQKDELDIFNKSGVAHSVPKATPENLASGTIIEQNFIYIDIKEINIQIDKQQKETNQIGEINDPRNLSNLMRINTVGAPNLNQQINRLEKPSKFELYKHSLKMNCKRFDKNGNHIILKKNCAYPVDPAKRKKLRFSKHKVTFCDQLENEPKKPLLNINHVESYKAYNALEWYECPELKVTTGAAPNGDDNAHCNCQIF